MRSYLTALIVMTTGCFLGPVGLAASMTVGAVLIVTMALDK